jgi:hypothetical protein
MLKTKKESRVRMMSRYVLLHSMNNIIYVDSIALASPHLGDYDYNGTFYRYPPPSPKPRIKFNSLA